MEANEMKRLLVLPALLGAAIAAQAQRYDAYGQPYGAERGYYEGNYGGDALNRAISDLRRVRTGWFDGRDQHHIDKAVSELYKFEDKYRRGHWDGDHLDRAIDNMKNLTDSGRLRPRDRDLIYGDIMSLRDFRASRGRYDRGRYNDGYRDDSYYRR
jgi:hypothetical protein